MSCDRTQNFLTIKLDLDWPKGLNKMINFLIQHVIIPMLKYVPWTQGMCDKVVGISPGFLIIIPDRFKTKKMCSEAVEREPLLLYDVPVCFRMKKMCERAVEKCLHSFRFVPNYVKTQEMCEKAAEDEPEAPKICTRPF